MREFRWVRSDTLDAPLLAMRDLAPEPADISSGLAAVDQQYSYSLFVPDGSGALRFDAFWLEARVIGVDVPDTFALDLSVTQMTRTAEQIDAWVAANPER
ncbi:MAG: hypothetical protein R3F61_24030 [Myxococcota bacterium]